MKLQELGVEEALHFVSEMSFAYDAEGNFTQAIISFARSALISEAGARVGDEWGAGFVDVTCLPDGSCSFVEGSLSPFREDRLSEIMKYIREFSGIAMDLATHLPAE